MAAAKVNIQNIYANEQCVNTEFIVQSILKNVDLSFFLPNS